LNKIYSSLPEDLLTAYYVFPLIQETITYHPPFTSTTNVPILVYSGERPEVLHGFLVQTCDTIRPNFSKVRTILFSPQPLVPGGFVAPPPYSNLGPI